MTLSKEISKLSDILNSRRYLPPRRNDANALPLLEPLLEGPIPRPNEMEIRNLRTYLSRYTALTVVIQDKTCKLALRNLR